MWNCLICPLFLYLSNRYRCDNSRCILWSSVCDEIQDCSDGSDESARACAATQGSHCSNPDNFRCANGRCISKEFVCDTFDSCGDSSDEQDCLEEKPCNFGACSQTCEIKVHTNLTRASTSTLINTKRIVSEAECSCIEGYVLEAKKTCKALGENASLLLANENTLRKIYPYAYHKMVDLHPGTLLFDFN